MRTSSSTLTEALEENSEALKCRESTFKSQTDCLDRQELQVSWTKGHLDGSFEATVTSGFKAEQFNQHENI